MNCFFIDNNNHSLHKKQQGKEISFPCCFAKLFRQALPDILLQLLFLAVVFVRNCKLCTSFSATSSQYAAAILSSHSLTETVLVFSLSVRGLECSFHRLIYLYVFIQKVLYAIQRAKLLFFFRMAKKCKGIFTK